MHYRGNSHGKHRQEPEDPAGTTLRQDALKGLISKESPVGKAVLGRRSGDRVQVDMGGGRGLLAANSFHRKGQRRRLHPHRQLLKKACRDCRPQAANKVQSVFCGGVYAAKNTSQSASVEFVRFQRTNYARSRLHLLSKKRALPFWTVSKGPPPAAEVTFVITTPQSCG